MIRKSKNFISNLLKLPYKTRKAITVFLDLITILITILESNYICSQIIDYSLKSITISIFPLPYLFCNAFETSDFFFFNAS